ncbi:2'-5' RNA ligase superfamily protein [Flavobacterium chryseum]|uniref:2'-5' RNA ligase family protein n=1 Tax=Flavobacterium sp. P3160 TaxID=2512113 RepID=UPI00105E3279|nr:2'-5' RNA ligase family protein [Flavobacterium sp. P3160]TDO71054.1 2'-5' RNA ligase superfamily protein [Flavobacterium sp. P3160]
MLKKYSVVFYPSQAVIDAIKVMKGYLKTKINWYNSCNSIAHITICEFEILESEIDKFKQKLAKICNTFTPFHVYLEEFSAYEHVGAFFIVPNEKSKAESKPKAKKTDNHLKKEAIKKNKSNDGEIEQSKLKSIMKKTQDTLKTPGMKKSNDPHMSIGRRLTSENLKIASELFTTIDLHFLCDSIVLREFDPEEKQFFIIDTFKFGSNPEPEFIQGSLF